MYVSFICCADTARYFARYFKFNPRRSCLPRSPTDEANGVRSKAKLAPLVHIHVRVRSHTRTIIVALNECSSSSDDLIPTGTADTGSSASHE